MDRSRRRRCISEDTAVPHPYPTLAPEDPQTGSGDSSFALGLTRDVPKATPILEGTETTATPQSHATPPPRGGSWLSRAAHQRREQHHETQHQEQQYQEHEAPPNATGSGSAYQLLRQFFDVWRPRGSQSPTSTTTTNSELLSSSQPPPSQANAADVTPAGGKQRAGSNRANRSDAWARTRSYTVGPSNPATGSASVPMSSSPTSPSSASSTAPGMTREELLGLLSSPEDDRPSSRGSSSSSRQTPAPLAPASAAQAPTRQQQQQQQEEEGKVSARSRRRTDSVEEDARFVLSASGLDLA